MTDKRFSIYRAPSVSDQMIDQMSPNYSSTFRRVFDNARIRHEMSQYLMNDVSNVCDLNEIHERVSEIVRVTLSYREVKSTEFKRPWVPVTS